MNKRILAKTGAGMLAASVLFTGCGSLNPSATAIKINTGDSTDTISLGYINFVAQYQTSIYDSFFMSYYGEGYMNQDLTSSGSTMGETTVDSVVDDLEEQYLCKLHASDYGVELTDDDNTAISDAVSAFMSDNDQESLDAMGATEDYVTAFLEYRTYQSRVEAAVKEASDAEVTDDECWQRTFSYVLFDTSASQDEDGVVQEKTDEELVDLKAQAKALAQAKTSDDFDTIAQEQGLTVSTYSYTKGEEEDDSLDMSVIEAAEALSEGQISSVIEVEDTGYYVLRLDADHDEEASETERETLLSEKQSDFYDTTLEGWKADVTWIAVEKQLDKISFTNHYTAPETEEEVTDTTDDASEDTSVEETTEDSDAEEAVEDADIAEDSDASDTETTEDSDAEEAAEDSDTTEDEADEATEDSTSQE